MKERSQKPQPDVFISWPELEHMVPFPARESIVKEGREESYK